MLKKQQRIFQRACVTNCGKPSEFQTEENDQHEGEPEIGHRYAPKSESHCGVIEASVLPDRGDDARRDRDDNPDEQGSHRKIKGCWVTLENNLEDRPAGRERQTKVAVDNFIPPIQKLDVDGLIQADLVLQRTVLFLADARPRVRIDSEHHQHRVSRNGTDEKKYRQANQNKNGDELE